MTAVNPPIYDDSGYNRSLKPSDAPKVDRAQITQQVTINTSEIRKRLRAYKENVSMKMPKIDADGFACEADEMAYKIIGGDDSVLTALNGLEAQFQDFYDDVEELRLLVQSIVQPLGIIWIDGERDKDSPEVAIKVGGTAPQGAPGKYNFGNAHTANISAGNAVVYDVPHLTEGINYGTPASGATDGKRTLVARAADKEAMAFRIHKEASMISADPDKYMMAMKSYAGVMNAKIRSAFALINSYHYALLMGIDQLLKDGILQLGDRGGELRTPSAPGQAVIADKDQSEHIVARLAEALSINAPNDVIALLPAGRFAATLTSEQRKKFIVLAQVLRERMVPPPVAGGDLAQVPPLNMHTEFGFKVDGDQFRSLGRSPETNYILTNEPVGALLHKSITHVAYMLESVVFAAYGEKRLIMGRASDTPNQSGMAIFELQLMPMGSLSDNY